ncbi:hypothetical protein C6499_01185 [Candidatus Poribacteria bacterium]|nr:MAG: hypothetical protein C6499_01185 [Candidatus Poribacteria bacterium]
MPNQNQPLVYFFAKSNFGDDQPDFIKIDYSTDLLNRLTTLQTGNEAPIREIGVIPFETEDEAREEEERIHSRFGAFRARGEWFYATPRIIQYIQNYAVQHTELLTEDMPTEMEDSSEILFGEQLAERRNATNITQEELATRVGCTRGYISFLENNRGTPGQSIYTKLVELFGEFSESITEVRQIELFGEFLDPTTETKFNNLLAVEMVGGRWISEDTAIDTFIEVIKELGIEKVKKLDLLVNGIPLIADCAYDGKAQREVQTETQTFYVVSGTNTITKKRILDDIANRLNVNMTVFANLRA